MKRGGALQRRTPLRSRKAHRSEVVADFPKHERPPTPPIDLAAAAAALQHAAKAAETPRTFGGPVADPVKADRPADDGSFSQATRTRILMRDGYACQRCGVAPGDAYPGISLQHRAARQMGGTNRPHISLPSNGLTLCGDGVIGCHGWVERNSDDAERLGYAVPSWADPATVPVWLATRSCWALLGEDGSAVRTTTPLNNDARNSAVRITP